MRGEGDEGEAEERERMSWLHKEWMHGDVRQAGEDGCAEDVSRREENTLQGT